MIRKVALTIDVVFESDETLTNEFLSEVINEMDYTFASTVEGVTITNTEIIEENYYD